MKQALNVVVNFVKSAGEKNLSVFAAGSAFFVILSVVPMLMVVSCMLPLVGVSEEILLESVAQFLPSTIVPFFYYLVHYVYSNSVGMLPVALLVAVWSAGRGMLSLIRGLNGIHGITEHRGYLKLRIISSFYTVVLLAGLVFTLVVSVFGQSIYENLLVQIPVLHGIMTLILKFRYILSTAILGIIFTFLYTYVPDRKLLLKKQCRGGFLAAVGCAVFSYCFSVYVDHYNDFSGYGSISIIIIIMLWLYFMMYILLYGAYIGSYFA